ncbi:Mitochondrial import inner membrane translocase subunit [Trichinella spiralis]|uniref:Mitochondrial import inner membrane translocase subunit n=1 Tax=Trichinella spiralis TaxID=6334 RepID=A0ABR3KDX5_TRISP
MQQRLQISSEQLHSLLKVLLLFAKILFNNNNIPIFKISSTLSPINLPLIIAIIVKFEKFSMDDDEVDLTNMTSTQREESISEKCLKACIKKPGKTLESSQQKCLYHCVDRYLETTNLVAVTYRNRLEQG